MDRLAAENPTWGVRRIAAELAVLGHPVSPTTVYRYRRIRPTPSPSWRTFLRLHAPEIWAADFFTVQTLTLRTFYVFFVISHDRRRIMHWNVTAHPTAPWVWRQIIAATPWNTAPRFLIRDRDRNYGGDFVPRAAALGIETVLTPVRAPKANAIAEAGHWHDPAGLSGPSHRADGTASPPGASRVRGLLQRYASPPVSGRPAAIRSTVTGVPRGRAAPGEPADSGAAYTMSTSGKRRDGVLEHHKVLENRIPSPADRASPA